jgi:hypothetical protein
VTGDPLQQLRDWAFEAVELRREQAERFPPAHAQMRQLYDALHLLRAAMYRVEELLGSAVITRGQARRWQQSQAHKAEDAFDQKSAQLRRAGRRDDYSTGRERQADISLQNLDIRRAERDAQRSRDEADDLLERIRVAYRGMDADRQMLNRMLGYLQWETNLER